jgi:hypothetical protein
MKGSAQWMGNFYMDELSPQQYDWMELNDLGFEVVMKSVTNTQQLRSYNLNIV